LPNSFPDLIPQIWQDYDNASSVLSKAAKLMADTDGRAACDLFIAAMDIMKARFPALQALCGLKPPLFSQDYDRLHMMGDTWRSTASHMMKQVRSLRAISAYLCGRFSMYHIFYSSPGRECVTRQSISTKASSPHSTS
jgi:hypothetical protein